MLSRLLTLAIAASLVPACGGAGAGSAPESAPLVLIEKSLRALPRRDGDVANDGDIFPEDGFWVGCTGLRQVSRSFLSFDLTAVPPGARIASATLTVHQEFVQGDPFAFFATVVVVDHVEIGVELDPTDFDMPAYRVDVGTISEDPEPGPRSLDVTRLVQDDLDAGRLTTEYRMRFADDDAWDEDRHMVVFNDADGVYGPDIPTLVVRYEVVE